MTIDEFRILSTLERISAGKRLVPRGVTASEVSDALDGDGFRNPISVARHLHELSRRNLVKRCRGRWYPTLYGSNVVTA
jgi:hypothetical protein